MSTWRPLALATQQDCVTTAHSPSASATTMKRPERLRACGFSFDFAEWAAAPQALVEDWQTRRRRSS
jgi:hypothetical protein